MIRAVLAGICGYGENYINEFLDRCPDGVELCGICDPYADRSVRFADITARGIPVYQSLKEFYSTNRADLAVISSPIHTHYDFMMCALNNGSYVLCEKPSCCTMKELDELIEKERTTGLFAAVGYQQCFSRDVLELKSDILSGMYGEPELLKALRLMRRGCTYYSRNSWAGKITCAGHTVYDSPLNNACAHEFQNMLFVLGKKMNATAHIESVDARLFKANPDIENYDTAALCALTDNKVPLYYYTAHPVREAKTGPFAQYVFSRAVIEYDGSGFAAYSRDGILGAAHEQGANRTQTDRELGAAHEQGAGRAAGTGAAEALEPGRRVLLKDYRKINKGDRLQKLYDCIQSIKDGTVPVCTLETTAEHMRAVHMAQSFPVKNADAQNFSIQICDDERCYVVHNIEQLFTACYNTNTLPARDCI